MAINDSPTLTGTAYLDLAGTQPANLSVFTGFTLNFVDILTDTVFYSTTSIIIVSAAAGIFSFTLPANTFNTVNSYYIQLVATATGVQNTFGTKPNAPTLFVKGPYNA